VTARVAVVEFGEDYAEPLRRALDLIGGIGDLNTEKRNVVVKVGLFQPSWPHHSSVDLVESLIHNFSEAPKVFLVESDNYVGKALKRLQVYRDLFTEHVVPFSLSDDRLTRRLRVANEEMDLADVMFKPNVFVDTHVLRNFPRGSILKNLFGCTPMVEKAKYHKKEVFGTLLADIFEAIGGIDLAVVDGTYLFQSATQIKVRANTLIVGRDAVAVETVADTLAGLKPERMEFMHEFVKRGLGEGNMENIEIIGTPTEELKEKFASLRKKLRITYSTRPRPPQISRTIDRLIEEGWMNKPRTVAEALDELKRMGVRNATRAVVRTTLERRRGKTIMKAMDKDEWVYQRKNK